jgi:hypothetical protein
MNEPNNKRRFRWLLPPHPGKEPLGYNQGEIDWRLRTLGLLMAPLVLVWVLLTPIRVPIRRLLKRAKDDQS